MMARSAVYQLMGETSASIFPLARDIMQPLFEKYFSERQFYQVIFMAYNRAPEPISTGLFCARTPYANPLSVVELLEGTADAGYLKPDGAGGYLITKRGSTAIEAVHEAFYGHINQANQLPEAKLKELANLLGRIVKSTRETDLAGGKTCFDLSHQGHIKVDPGTLAQVDQFLDDLIAFRDDAHTAAWKPAGVDGRTWETLTLVWNGEANTAEKLVERLPYRQYTASDYQGALEDLVQRGWIVEDSEGYRVNGQGKKIRDQAEVDTNTYFFEPWKALTDKEVGRLGELLSELKEIHLSLADELNVN